MNKSSNRSYVRVQLKGLPLENGTSKWEMGKWRQKFKLIDKNMR